MPAYYTAKLIGDGLTPETAFRPDIPVDVDWACISTDEEAGTMVFVSNGIGLQVLPTISTTTRTAAAAELGITSAKLGQEVAAWISPDVILDQAEVLAASSAP